MCAVSTRQHTFKIVEGKIKKKIKKNTCTFNSHIKEVMCGEMNNNEGENLPKKTSYHPFGDLAWREKKQPHKTTKKINGTDNKKGLNVQCGGAGRGFLHLSEAQNHQKLVAFFTNVCIQLQHFMIFQQKK